MRWPRVRGSVRYPYLHYRRKTTIECLLLDKRPRYRWYDSAGKDTGAEVRFNRRRLQVAAFEATPALLGLHGSALIG